MRLRVLELPTQVDGERVESRYAYVLDDVRSLPVDQLTRVAAGLRESQATDTFVFAERIELGE